MGSSIRIATVCRAWSQTLSGCASTRTDSLNISDSGRVAQVVRVLARARLGCKQGGLSATTRVQTRCLLRARAFNSRSVLRSLAFLPRPWRTPSPTFRCGTRRPPAQGTSAASSRRRAQSTAASDGWTAWPRSACASGSRRLHARWLGVSLSMRALAHARAARRVELLHWRRA